MQMLDGKLENQKVISYETSHLTKIQGESKNTVRKN